MTGFVGEEENDGLHYQIYQMTKGATMLKAGRMVKMCIIYYCFHSKT